MDPLPTLELEWGGTIKSYLSVDDRKTAPDSQMELLVGRLADLEKATTFQSFLVIFIGFKVRQVHYLNSPLLDALWKGFYRAPLPPPEAPETGVIFSVADSFLQMCQQVFDYPEAVKYLLKREELKKKNVLFISVFFAEVIKSGNDESFRLVLEHIDLPSSKLRIEVCLETACRVGTVEMVKLMVPLLPRRHGFGQCNPFVTALKRGDLEIIKHLYQEGIYESFLDLIEITEASTNLEATEWICDEQLKKYPREEELKEHGYWAAQESYDKALKGACFAGKAPLMEILIKRGANPLQFGIDLLMRTISFKHLEATKVLLAHGVPCSSEHLVAAVTTGSLLTIELLLGKGVDPEADHHLALKAAFDSDNRNVIERLLTHYRTHPQASSQEE